MQKVMYFAPGVTALVLYGLPALSGGLGAMHGAVWFFIALLFVSALLLWRGKWWGCLGGVLAGMVLIDMSTRYTGQVIEIEGPLGILFCIYYGLCGLMVWKKESAQRSAQESQGEPYLKVDLIQLRLLLVFSVSSYFLFMQGFAFPSLSVLGVCAPHFGGGFPAALSGRWPATVTIKTPSAFLSASTLRKWCKTATSSCWP